MENLNTQPEFKYTTKDVTETDGENTIKVELKEDDDVIWLNLVRKDINGEVRKFPEPILFIDKRDRKCGKVKIINEGNHKNKLKSCYGLSFTNR